MGTKRRIWNGSYIFPLIPHGFLWVKWLGYNSLERCFKMFKSLKNGQVWLAVKSLFFGFRTLSNMINMIRIGLKRALSVRIDCQKGHIGQSFTRDL